MSQEDVVAELRHATNKKTDYDREAIRLLNRIAIATESTARRVYVIECIVVAPLILGLLAILTMYGAMHH